MSISKPRLVKHAFCFKLAVLEMKTNACFFMFLSLLLVSFVSIMFVINNMVRWDEKSMF